ncbi:MAG: hypothetical protein A2504_16180 [Bdellovibrionales bacterium RIFOXYD12_FULL_39_22]|nr:MAG: hypothetical protein A2385_08090 [Bdellovibrionales bacterium RIFOXYB1_FULL_39_21]OFZ42982.1 MAG: hypothetical protein A2485_11135 [Bdellovibrionales bacterium RIFOXYC12_FULL_39_17]OFZ50932.1 MAG: hypothetical protein A2404_07005 [Bdellovibrionales bacterium RIFOXYC1_FULL_39_130]OFZ74064.1 MAG: hypothetical protein A2451_12165 [Bdellovibrionales bacterium RIFOXYC2_FULL_39_8]OFZ78155.1 MAG: hypothetical protein A2560_02175 [Bdellovibrionales bacterium RIFOXYD1_FULL_39_84]OFZ94023.1 MAG:
MYSKYSPWDFKREHDSVLSTNGDKFYAIKSADCYVEKFVIDRVKKHHSDISWVMTTGSQLTVSWLEEQLLEFNFFKGNDGHIVLGSELISSAVKDFFLANAKKLDNYVVLFFQKSTKGFEELVKGSGTFFSIEAPNFWEWSRYLSYLLAEMEVSLSAEIRNYIVSNVPNTPDDTIRAINATKELDKEKISPEELKELLGGNRLDVFAMASLWTQKKRGAFYQKIIDGGLDEEQVKTLFAFMQGHLIRLSDPSYLEKKSSLSKYDREISQMSQQWTAQEVAKDLRIFADGYLKIRNGQSEHWRIIKNLYVENMLF